MKSGPGWAILMWVTCVGLVGVGCIDERRFVPHGVAAAMAFAGAILGGSLVFPQLLKAALAGAAWVNRRAFYLIGTTVSALFVFALNELRIHGVKIPSKDLNPAEWAMLIMLFVGVLGLHFILVDPEEAGGT